MASQVISQLICTVAVIVLILAMPVFFAQVTEKTRADLSMRGLQEIADYTSDTLGNLCFLANSSGQTNITLTKQLNSLPSIVENHYYNLSIVNIGGTTAYVAAYLQDDPSVVAYSWLAHGLKVDISYRVQSGLGNVLASCVRNSTGFYLGLRYG